MSICPDDFAWMWQGIVKKPFIPAEAHYLAPIRQHRGKTGHAILVLHGFSSSPAVYRTMMNAFDGYDGVVVPCLPGHGQSIASFSKATAQDWIACAEKECEQLLSQYERVDVLGLSLGGYLAHHLALRHPIHHLFLLAPALALHFPMNLGGAIPLFLKKMGLRALRSQGGNIQNHNMTELTYRKLPMQAIIEILNLVKSFSFTQPTCPVDVFLGKFDAVINNSKILKWFEHQPQTQIHWLNNSAHVLPLDTNQQQISKIIQTHLMNLES